MLQTSLSHKKKLIEAYITMKRSDEELKMLAHEIQNTIMYWHTRKMHIKKQLRLVKESPLSTTGTSNLYLRETQCLFTKLFYEAEQFLLRCEIAFSQFIPLVSLSESSSPSCIDDSEHSSPSCIDDYESVTTAWIVWTLVMILMRRIQSDFTVTIIKLLYI